MRNSALFFGMTQKTSAAMDNESCDYLAIQDLLKVVVALRNYLPSEHDQVLVTTMVDGRSIDENIDQSLAKVANQIKSARTAAIQVDTEAAEDLEEDDFGLNEDLDVSDPEDLKKLYCAIEFQLKSERYINGHVEYAIVNQTESVLMIVEAKNTNLFTAPIEVRGTYQLCGKMVSTADLNGVKDRPMFGILTNYSEWIFFKLENNRITKSRNIFLFVDTVEYGSGLFQIMCFLLDILEIPPTINVEQVFDKINQSSRSVMEDALKTCVQLSKVDSI